MADPLPPFADQWIAQWKAAAPRLQVVRDEELRRTGGGPRRTVDGARIFDRHPERHGMVIMQRWFMRRHLLDLIRNEDPSIPLGNRRRDGQARPQGIDRGRQSGSCSLNAL